VLIKSGIRFSLLTHDEEDFIRWAQIFNLNYAIDAVDIRGALYRELLAETTTRLQILSDKPEETAESTLRALWQAATGVPMSAERASNRVAGTRFSSGREIANADVARSRLYSQRSSKGSWSLSFWPRRQGETLKTPHPFPLECF
jgi:hypothetical protein